MMELPPLKYTLDNIVIGWREEAISFAREHGYHLIVNSDQRPFHYFVGYQDVKHRWYEGVFDLGMRSLLPIPFDVQSLGFEDGNLKVITKNNTKVLLEFKELHLFDLDHFTNLNVEEIVENHIVHDMFDVVQGSRLGVELSIFLHDEFLKVIKFVTSNRIDRNTGGEFKDIITKSVVCDEDIRNFDFSETVVRLLVERKQPNGRSLKLRHSLRHSAKNEFSFNVVGPLDDRIILHE